MIIIPRPGRKCDAPEMVCVGSDAWASCSCRLLSVRVFSAALRQTPPSRSASGDGEGEGAVVGSVVAEIDLNTLPTAAALGLLLSVGSNIASRQLRSGGAMPLHGICVDTLSPASTNARYSASLSMSASFHGNLPNSRYMKRQPSDQMSWPG